MPISTGNANNDPHLLREVLFNSPDTLGFAFTASRTRVSSAIVGGQKTLVVVLAGQSTGANYDNTLYTPMNSLVHNFNIYDGATYQAKDPLIGCSGYAGGCWLGRLGDKLISNAICDRPILVPTSIGSSEVAMWAPGGFLNHRFAVIQKRLTEAGLTPSCLIWQQGERDKTIGTDQATYAAGLAGVISTWRGLYPSVPVFVNKVSVTSNTAYTPVQNAQVAAVDHTNGIWAGADSDSLGSGNRQSDGTHWNATGSDAIAGLMVTALHAYGAPF